MCAAVSVCGSDLQCIRPTASSWRESGLSGRSSRWPTAPDAMRAVHAAALPRKIHASGHHRIDGRAAISAWCFINVAGANAKKASSEQLGKCGVPESKIFGSGRDKVQSETRLGSGGTTVSPLSSLSMASLCSWNRAFPFRPVRSACC